jgi:hypothetical protein
VTPAALVLLGYEHSFAGSLRRSYCILGQLAAQSRTIDDLRSAHEKAGVEFIAGANLATQDQ